MNPVLPAKYLTVIYHDQKPVRPIFMKTENFIFRREFSYSLLTNELGKGMISRRNSLTWVNLSPILNLPLVFSSLLDSFAWDATKNVYLLLA